MTQFFAVGLATALGGLHKRELIHKDVKPANVLVNPATGQVRLMGFSIASRLPHERQTPEPPEFIAGTLAYMAPEQTGRMNRSIDSRSDLYSLGVTLYEMLTGTLPFTASDPMELVHCHIARQPTPPHMKFKGIPDAVSAIVMKLLAKTAEERYQTAMESRGIFAAVLSNGRSSIALTSSRLANRTCQTGSSFQRNCTGANRRLARCSPLSTV
jgi:serine/threonine protein kinase